WIGSKITELFTFNDVADPVARHVCFEIILYRWDSLCFLRFVVGYKLCEFLLEQFILRFESRDEAKDFFENLSQRDASVYSRSFAQLLERIPFACFLKQLAIYVINYAIPVPSFDAS